MRVQHGTAKMPMGMKPLQPAWFSAHTSHVHYSDGVLCCGAVRLFLTAATLCLPQLPAPTTAMLPSLPKSKAQPCVLRAMIKAVQCSVLSCLSQQESCSDQIGMGNVLSGR